MGSGCTNSSNISKGCYNVISSNCVSFQGFPLERYDVCDGDTITEIIDTILQELLKLSGGTGVTVNIQNVCDSIAVKLVGKDKNVLNVVQAIADTLCSLIDEVTNLEEIVNAPVSYDLKCLTVSQATTPKVLQAVIDKVCVLQTSINNIIDQLNNGDDLGTTINNSIGNFLINAISSCGNNGIVKSGSGANATISFTGMVPLYVPVPYIGSLSNFDSTGKGLPNSGYCGWYIMNGLNGTQNWLGYTFSGATSLPGIQSTPLDTRVSGSGDGANIGDKKGEVKHQLTVNEMPNHTHNLTDNGHRHGVTVHKPTGTTAGNLGYIAGANTEVGPQNLLNTELANSGITIDSTGNNQSHENRQPTTYGVWIVRLP